MNILVTGGTGFVGKALVEALLSRGDSVTVLTRSIEKAQAIFPEKTLQLCIDWENAAKQANTRVCLVRTGLVLSPKGGAFAKILPLYRFGLGGKLGNGEQYWSWIALEDMVKGLLFLLDHNDCEGVFNFTAPHPVKNKTFNQLLGQALHRPCFAQVPQFLLTSLLGERACILLDSQNATLFSERAFTNLNFNGPSKR